MKERTHKKLSKKSASGNNEEAFRNTASPEKTLTLYEFLEEESNQSFPDGDKASPRKREDIFEPLDAHIHKTSCVSPKPPEKDLEDGDKAALGKKEEFHQKPTLVPRPPQDKLKPSEERNEPEKSEPATTVSSEQFSESVDSSLSADAVFQQRLASWRQDCKLFEDNVDDSGKTKRVASHRLTNRVSSAAKKLPPIEEKVIIEGNM